MVAVWDQARVEQYLTQGTEESLTLDYKAAGSLAKSDGKKAEITKDVSAMANSAGGILIYGVAEYQDDARRHLPERLDPIDRIEFTKEWLEQVISNIQPKTDGVIIHPVPLSSAPNHVAYVVEIPQSHTAHQAKDFRYYKRFNFESVPMADYEIRDVMNRIKHPVVVPKFGIFLDTETKIAYGNSAPTPLNLYSEPTSARITKITLVIFGVNEGSVFANYVNISFMLPSAIVYQDKAGDAVLEELFGIMPPLNEEFRAYSLENTERDVIDVKPNLTDVTYKYGPSRYVPILPKRYFTWEVRLSPDFLELDQSSHFIEWEIFADNAAPLSGRIAVADIKIVDRRTD